MGKLFDYENPLLRFLSRMADLFLLNVLTLLCCLPVVTIGAAVTAAHYTALKLRRGEDYVAQNYWKSFKENLKQSTVIWVLTLLFFAAEYLAYITLSSAKTQNAQMMQGWVLATAVFGVCIMLWIFPLQSRFINPIRRTFYTAFIMTFKHLFRTVLLLAFFIAPFLLGIRWIMALLLYGCSVPVYLSAVLYDKVFQRMEEEVRKHEGV